MKLQTTIKMAVLVPVVCATWFITTSIVAGSKQQHPPGIMSAGEQHAANSTTREAKLDATFERKQFNLAVDGNRVAVSASVAMMARKQDSLYMWRLRAFLEDGSVLDTPYIEQAFTMDPSGQMAPSFLESFQAPRGKHRILLHLYQVPLGYDLTELSDETKAEAALVIGAHKMIEIQ